MQKFDVYEDIAKRTGGDIYIGVVGPVRTGKSTFVKRFAENIIVPDIQDPNKRKVATDELPQSGTGKTVTTTEPKFIPSEAVNVVLGKSHASVRLIDCVGFMVDGAIGSEEDGFPRMVQTPWDDSPVTFEEAAEKGTDKVIREHSTVGVVVTSDGSFTGINRSDYVIAEEKTIFRLKEIGKPFVIVLNSNSPESKACQTLKDQLVEKYGVTVVCLDVLTCSERDFIAVLEQILNEFPIKRFDLVIPDWLRALPVENRVVGQLINSLKTSTVGLTKMRDCIHIEQSLAEVDKVIPLKTEVFAGEGRAQLTLSCEKDLFYEVLSETCGETIDGEYKLMSFVRDLSEAKWEYDKIKTALSEAESKGYGIVFPTEKEMSLSAPTLVKNGNRYGVAVNAETESLHIVKVGVRATVNPIAGTKKQCEDFIEFINSEQEDEDISNIKVFGRPLGKVALDEVRQKSGGMPEDTQNKLQRMVGKMVNDGKYRMIYLVY